MANVENPSWIKKGERHVIWDSENSPNSSEDKPLRRFHFVVVDNKNLEGKMERILKNCNDKSIINFSFEEIDRVEGDVIGTNLNYLYTSYDSSCTPKYVSFKGVSEKSKRDSNLIGRKVIFVKDYLERIYGPNA